MSNYTTPEVIAERERIIAQLIKLRVLRESMLGDAWFVMYTEDGPTDITRKSLLKVTNE
jgi:hypothetical protein